MAEQTWGFATEIEDVNGAVSIAGVGESEHTKASGRTPREITATAVERALEDAGLDPGQVDGLMYNLTSPDFDANAFREHFGTSQEIWESDAGGGMVWAGTAPWQAARALRSGKARYILNVFSVAWASQRGQMTGGPGQFHAAELFKQNLELPFGWFPQPVYFSTIARRHMHEFGTTEDQLGAIAVSCRRHANENPAAVMHGRPLSLEDYRASPKITDPFRKEDCCLISDGGGAYLMTTPERAADLRKHPITVRGVGMGNSNAGLHWAEQADFTATPQVFSAPAAFAMAGLQPADVDVFSCYDPFTIVTLMQLEDMGFCAKGEGGTFVADGGLDFDGNRLPGNTHGGMLSHAYVLGIAHIVEIVRQLRGEAAAQVEHAKTAVYGGYTGPQASTLLLQRSDA